MIKTQFQNEISDRGITRLCHITKSVKALHILSSEDGVKAVDFLDEDIYDANDMLRFDGKKDFVNCSIQYPNHWYWRKVRDDRELFRDWVILLINPDIILNDTTHFSAVNAAKAHGAYIKQGYGAFQELYGNYVGGRCRASNMLSCCPTDDQAEVLIYKNISRKDIIGVAVENEKQAEKELVRWECLGGVPELDIVIAPDLYNGNWSQKVRQGRAPLEIKYQGGET